MRVVLLSFLKDTLTNSSPSAKKVTPEDLEQQSLDLVGEIREAMQPGGFEGLLAGIHDNGAGPSRSKEQELDSDYEGDTEDDAEDSEGSEDYATDSDDGLPEAIYDKVDCIYRCTECNWEVVDTECSYCGTEHVVFVVKVCIAFLLFISLVFLSIINDEIHEV